MNDKRLAYTGGTRAISVTSAICLLSLTLAAPACSFFAPPEGHNAPSAAGVDEARAPVDMDGSRRGRARPRSPTRRLAEPRLHGRVMPLADRYHPRIASEAQGSISVGTVTEGYLAAGAEMPLSGPHHRILDHIVDRHTRFTTDQMKALLLCAADKVAAAHPDHRLYIGNLSRRGGGDIPWSVSHNNGRDADLAFLARRPDGTAAQPAHLYAFGRTLEASEEANEPMIFDVAANWTLVKSLLACEDARIDKLFIARWLRAPLLRYARAIKEPRALIYRAAAVLRQPSRTSSHSDHLHLRIGCSDEDVAEGCMWRGRAPEEAIGELRAVRRRLPALRLALTSTDPKQRAGAAYLLGLYHDHASTPALAAALGDSWPEVRLRAVSALARMKAEGAAALLSAALDNERDPRVAVAQLRAFEQLGAIEQLAARLRDPRVLPGDNDAVPDVIVRKVALELLEESDSLAAAGMVVPLLADNTPSVREQAHRTLGRIVNRSTADLVLHFATEDAEQDARAGRPFQVHWPLTPADHVSLWSRFLATLPSDVTRNAVVLEGFRQRGLPLAELDRSGLSYLASALRWERPYRDNAARYISHIVDYEPEMGRGSRATPDRFWLPWLTRRRMINRDLVELVRGMELEVARRFGAGHP